MARFLLLFMILAEFSIFIAEIEATVIAKSMHPKAVKGTEMWMVALMQPPVASPAPSEGGIISESLSIRQMRRHHHFTDNSVAGGDMILGGFITAIVAAVVCYIRVTRKSKISDARV